MSKIHITPPDDLLKTDSPAARLTRSRLRQAVFPETGIALRPVNPFDKALDDVQALRLFYALSTPEQQARVHHAALHTAAEDSRNLTTPEKAAIR